MNNRYLYGALVLVLIVGAFTWVSYVNSPAAPAGSQSATAAQPRSIAWNAAQFPSATVSLTLIRKTGSNPDAYQIVRNLAAGAANNGSATWIPASGEIDGTTYIQIGCVNSTSACQAMITPAN